MNSCQLIGTTIAFQDAYTGVETFGRIDQIFGDAAIIRVIKKDEAGTNPRRVKPRPDARIASITHHIGLIE